ncbi:hypothetical protein [Leclercia sp. W17]|uniref:hypothetical protein n=1 Tax=Leclercia sp. W17 TaxID=2282309 RepID=UPI001AF010C1|nr:hypothetical protein [Leclercia sp. W17]
MNEREQLAKDNGMTIEFVNWFFDNKKDGCGNAWFIMMAAMWEGWSGREAKCAALAAELSQAKSVVSECREYFIAGIMNRIRPTNEGYLHMRCDTLGDETPSHDAFLAEVRAQGVEMFAALLTEMDISCTERGALTFATQLRQEAAQ